MKNCGLTRYLIRSKNNNPDKYDEKYMKIKFNSQDDLPINKTLELRNVILIARSVFHENKKYYLQVSLIECFY